MSFEYPAINVPENCDNPAAYIRAAHRRIDQMRATRAAKKKAEWFAADPSRIALVEAMRPMIDFEYRRSENGEPGFMGKMMKSINDFGSLTPKQEEAVRASLARSKARAEERAKARAEQHGIDAAKSQFVGQVGERRVFALTMKRTVSFVGNFGPAVVNEMCDAEGNVFVYIGANQLAKEGEALNLKATIKRHNDRDGVKQTALSRPIVVAV